MEGISVIIPTLNEEKNIGRLLDALSPQLKKGDEIIIADSFSKDKTISIAKRYRCKIVSVPPKGKPLAVNVAAKKASNEIIALLDADSMLCNNWMGRIRTHMSDKETKAVTGLDLYSSRSNGLEAIYNLYSGSVFTIALLVYGLGGKPFVVSNNCAMRKRVFLKIGGYAHMVCEDAELMRRWPRSARVDFDSKLNVYLSDRRFRKEGFVKTLILWFVADVKVWLGSGIPWMQYKRNYA